MRNKWFEEFPVYALMGNAKSEIFSYVADNASDGMTFVETGVFVGGSFCYLGNELKKRTKGLELSRQLKERRKALEEAIAREQAAMRSTIESQYVRQEGQFGGPDRQTEREQAGPGYGDVSEAGSFKYGGIAGL